MRKLVKKYAIQDLRIELKNIMKDKTLKFNGFTAVLPTPPKRKYTCYQCWEKFIYAHELTKHKLIHKKEEEEEQEKQRQEKLKKQSQLKKDQPVIKNSVEVDLASSFYRCEICNIAFETINDVKKHASSKCKFYCGKCKRHFNTMQGFNIHILQHKINNIKPREEKRYTCSECSKVFFDIIQLRSHTLLKHSKKSETSESSYNPANIGDAKPKVQEISNESHLTCELCFDVFTNPKDFEEHMDFHKQLANGNENMENKKKETEVNEMKFPVIESSYSLADSVQENQETSSSSEYKSKLEGVLEANFEIMKPNDVLPQEHYKCKKCFRLYMSMNEYNNHLQKNCTIFKTCSECSKQVKGNVHFYSHFSKTHKKIFICEYCFEIIKNAKDIDPHKLLHLKCFKNVCKICFKISKNYSAFNKHLNEHFKF